MLYVIYAQDIADSLEKRLSVRPAHLARLQLCCGGRLCAGFSKTLQESILTKQKAIFIYKNTEQ